ncbi:MAG TPA: tol-pal system protein YbgF [Candidatus Eisenbacteria bacterium]
MRRPPRAPRVLRAPAAAAALAALLAAGAFGCAPSGYYRSSQSSLDSLLSSQAEMMKRINTLDRKVETTRESVQATRASSDTRLNDLSSRMEVLEGKVDASGERFTRVAEKIDNVKERLTRADSARAAGGTMGRDSTAILDPESAYNAAYADLSAGRYDLARQAFGEYLKHYPDTERSDNAQYWVGECLYATGDFDGSIIEYAKVVDRYPKGDKVAAALLKTGYAHARMNRPEEAKKSFRLVVQRYPKSDEARLAKERLASKS